MGYCGIGSPDLQPEVSHPGNYRPPSATWQSSFLTDSRPLPTPPPASYHGSMRDQLPPCPPANAGGNVAECGKTGQNRLSQCSLHRGGPAVGKVRAGVPKCLKMSQFVTKCPNRGPTPVPNGPAKRQDGTWSLPDSCSNAPDVSQIRKFGVAPLGPCVPPPGPARERAAMKPPPKCDCPLAPTLFSSPPTGV